MEFEISNFVYTCMYTKFTKLSSGRLKVYKVSSHWLNYVMYAVTDNMYFSVRIFCGSLVAAMGDEATADRRSSMINTLCCHIKFEYEHLHLYTKFDLWHALWRSPSHWHQLNRPTLTVLQHLAFRKHELPQRQLMLNIVTTFFPKLHSGNWCEWTHYIHRWSYWGLSCQLTLIIWLEW
jgi:hypothetical protein